MFLSFTKGRMLTGNKSSFISPLPFPAGESLLFPSRRSAQQSQSAGLGCTMNCREELGIRETNTLMSYTFYSVISDTTWLSELVSWTAPSQCTVPLLSLPFTTTLFPSNQSVSFLSFTPFIPFNTVPIHRSINLFPFTCSLLLLSHQSLISYTSPRCVIFCLTAFSVILLHLGARSLWASENRYHLFLPRS